MRGDVTSTEERPGEDTEALQHHIAHLTGLKKSTLYDYRSYLKNDIAPVLGDLPLKALTREDIANWVRAMEEKGHIREDDLEQARILVLSA
ncbi:MAG: hypothetical protein JWR34_3402 [Mycobacterium sp.]|nr:hypothetical protein [Mycobacterium sp.]